MLPEITRKYNLDDWTALTDSERLEFEDKVVAAYALCGSSHKVAQRLGLTTRHVAQIISRRVTTPDASDLPTLKEVAQMFYALDDMTEEIGVDCWSQEASHYFHARRENWKHLQRIAEVGGTPEAEVWISDEDLAPPSS